MEIGTEGYVFESGPFTSFGKQVLQGTVTCVLHSCVLCYAGAGGGAGWGGELPGPGPETHLDTRVHPHTKVLNTVQSRPVLYLLFPFPGRTCST